MTRRSAFSVGAGTVIGATAAAGLAWGGYHLAGSTEGKDTGPTAATLNEAFATYYGVMAGLALGAASGLAASRRRSPALALGSSLGAAALFALALAVTGRLDGVIAVALAIAAVVAGIFVAGIAALPLALRKRSLR